MNPGLSLISTFMLLLAAAIGGGAIAVRLKLPSIVGYIAGGILVGNTLSGAFDHSVVALVSEAGVTLLLFALGVEFSFHKLKKTLHVVSWPAVGQMVVTLLAVMLLLIWLKMGFVPALFLASAAALSSTAIVVKVLSERGELDSHPGELATGWLVVQDLAVVPILILLTAISGNTMSAGGNILTILGTVVFALVKAAILITAVLYLGSKGIPKLLNAVAAFPPSGIIFINDHRYCFFVGLLTYHILTLCEEEMGATQPNQRATYSVSDRACGSCWLDHLEK